MTRPDEVIANDCDPCVLSDTPGYSPDFGTQRFANSISIEMIPGYDERFVQALTHGASGCDGPPAFSWTSLSDTIAYTEMQVLFEMGEYDIETGLPVEEPILGQTRSYSIPTGIIVSGQIFPNLNGFGFPLEERECSIPLCACPGSAGDGLEIIIENPLPVEWTSGHIAPAVSGFLSTRYFNSNMRQYENFSSRDQILCHSAKIQTALPPQVWETGILDDGVSHFVNQDPGIVWLSLGDSSPFVCPGYNANGFTWERVQVAEIFPALPIRNTGIINGTEESAGPTVGAGITFGPATGATGNTTNPYSSRKDRRLPYSSQVWPVNRIPIDTQSQVDPDSVGTGPYWPEPLPSPLSPPYLANRSPCGVLDDCSNCRTEIEYAGGAGITENTYQFAATEQKIILSYQTYTVPDHLKVWDTDNPSTVFFDTGGPTGTQSWRSTSFIKPADVTSMTVWVSGEDGTAWVYSFCSSTDDPLCCYERDGDNNEDNARSPRLIDYLNLPLEMIPNYDATKKQVLAHPATCGIGATRRLLTYQWVNVHCVELCTKIRATSDALIATLTKVAVVAPGPAHDYSKLYDSNEFFGSSYFKDRVGIPGTLCEISFPPPSPSASPSNSPTPPPTNTYSYPVPTNSLIEPPPPPPNCECPPGFEKQGICRCCPTGWKICTIIGCPAYGFCYDPNNADQNALCNCNPDPSQTPSSFRRCDSIIDCTDLPAAGCIPRNRIRRGATWRNDRDVWGQFLRVEGGWDADLDGREALFNVGWVIDSTDIVVPPGAFRGHAFEYIRISNRRTGAFITQFAPQLDTQRHSGRFCVCFQNISSVAAIAIEFGGFPGQEFSVNLTSLGCCDQLNGRDGVRGGSVWTMRALDPNGYPENVYPNDPVSIVCNKQRDQIPTSCEQDPGWHQVGQCIPVQDPNNFDPTKRAVIFCCPDGFEACRNTVAVDAYGLCVPQDDPCESCRPAGGFADIGPVDAMNLLNSISIENNSDEAYQTGFGRIDRIHNGGPGKHTLYSRVDESSSMVRFSYEMNTGSDQWLVRVKSGSRDMVFSSNKDSSKNGEISFCKSEGVGLVEFEVECLDGDWVLELAYLKGTDCIQSVRPILYQAPKSDGCSCPAGWGIAYMITQFEDADYCACCPAGWVIIDGDGQFSDSRCVDPYRSNY